MKINTQTRIYNLERQTTSKQHGIPIRLREWTDYEHMAIVKGLNLFGYPILSFIHEDFMANNKVVIDKILANCRKRKMLVND